MYTVSISNKAEKALLKLPDQVYSRVTVSLKNLAQNPRPSGCKKLKGVNAWRIRIGDYRIIYEIHDQKLLVLIITIGNRKDIYNR